MIITPEAEKARRILICEMSFFFLFFCFFVLFWFSLFFSVVFNMNCSSPSFRWISTNLWNDDHTSSCHWLWWPMVPLLPFSSICTWKDVQNHHHRKATGMKWEVKGTQINTNSVYHTRGNTFRASWLARRRWWLAVIIHLQGLISDEINGIIDQNMAMQRVSQHFCSFRR